MAVRLWNGWSNCLLSGQPTGNRQTGGLHINASDEQRIVSILKPDSLHAYLTTCDGDQPMVHPAWTMAYDDMSDWVITYGMFGKVKRLLRNLKICLAFAENRTGWLSW
jgi:hypothetical protein